MTFDDTRARIASLTEERETLKRYKLNPAEACAAVERALARAAESFRGAKLRAALSDAATSGAFSLNVAALDVVGLLASVLGPEKLAEALTRDVSAEVDDGPTSASRAERLAEIGAELRRLGIEEERWIRERELLGDFIPRRADADSSIVLAEVLQ